MRTSEIFGLVFCFLGATRAIIPDKPSDYKMVVTWGKPLKATTPVPIEISWDDCIKKCWNDSNCVLVYDTTPTCELYSLEQITTVQKLSSRFRVAFRVLRRNQTCTDANTDPLLLDGTVQSDVFRDSLRYVNNQYLPYKITLENDVWTFVQRNSAFPCDVPMMPVRRGTDIWCMNVRGMNYCGNRTQAETDSLAQKQLITGPANQEEYEFLRNTAMGMLTNPPSYTVPPGYTALGFWMDGIRKASCTYPQTAGCSRTNEFAYADPYANPPTLKWLSGQPDGLTSGRNSNCVYFIARSSDPEGIDDMPCGQTNFTELGLCMVGYFGGKLLGSDTFN